MAQLRRIRMSSRPVRRGLVGLLIASLAGLLHVAPASANDLVITVDPFGPVTSGEYFDVTVRLSGASATDIARGIEWTLTGPSIEINGWGVSTDSTGYQERRPTRYLGTTAVFTVYAEINGTYRFDAQARLDTGDAPRVARAPVEVQVASPDVLSVPAPPAFLNLETQGIQPVIPATIAYFQARLDIDPSFSPQLQPYQVRVNAGMPAVFGPELRYSNVATYSHSGGPTPWFDLAVDWRASQAPLRVSLSTVMPDQQVLVYYSRSIDLPDLNFDQDAVLEVFPPKVVGRCVMPKPRVLCDIGVFNEAGLPERLAVAPDTVPVKVQIGVKKKGTRKITWRKALVRDPSLNSQYVRQAISVPKRLRKQGEIVVRMEVVGHPRSARVFVPQEGSALDQVEFMLGSKAQ